MSQDIPTLYEWAGGAEALNRLTRTFYDKVLQDPVVGPVFKKMSPDHPAHVAAFIGEVFGGPKTYSEKHGGHREMVMHHLGKHLSEEQRRRWINLLADAADAVGLPEDPEFRSAFMGYVEWGSRLAKMNSNLGETCDPETEPTSTDPRRTRLSSLETRRARRSRPGGVSRRAVATPRTAAIDPRTTTKTNRAIRRRIRTADPRRTAR